MKNVALITGADGGIGSELCKIHASLGGDLIIVARNSEKLYDLKKKLEKIYNVSVYVIISDLTLPDATKKVYQEVKTNNIQIDYLFNNAGFGAIGNYWELNENQNIGMIKLNVLALSELTQWFLPDMVKRGSGRILNTSSIASLVPGPLMTVYFASKAYVRYFGNALNEELRGTGVTVTTLLPGPTASGFGSRSGMDKTILFKKVATPSDVATKAYKAMLKGRLNVIAGVSGLLRFLFLWEPFIPQKLLLRIVKRLLKV